MQPIRPSTFEPNGEPTIVTNRMHGKRCNADDHANVTPSISSRSGKNHSWWSEFSLTRSKGKRQKDNDIDACVIRTHVPEGIALAGQRVNHSAKAPCDIMLIDGRGRFLPNYIAQIFGQVRKSIATIEPAYDGLCEVLMIMYIRRRYKYMQTARQKYQLWLHGCWNVDPP